METSEKFLAPLTFNAGNLKKIGDDPGSTNLAILIILINALLGGFQESTSSSSNLENIPGITASSSVVLFIMGFAFYLLLLLFLSWGIKVAAGWLGAKGKVDSVEVLRMIGFSSIWSIIGFIIFLLLPVFPNIFGLLSIIAFSIGLGASADIGPFKAFISFILGFFVCIIAVFLVMLGLAFVLTLVFG